MLLASLKISYIVAKASHYNCSVVGLRIWSFIILKVIHRRSVLFCQSKEARATDNFLRASLFLHFPYFRNCWHSGLVWVYTLTVWLETNCFERCQSTTNICRSLEFTCFLLLLEPGGGPGKKMNQKLNLLNPWD